METQKVSDLETVQSVGLTDFITVLTDEIDNVVEKIKVDDFVNAGYFIEKMEEISAEQIAPIYNVIYNTIYPIGSIYSGTMANCPIPIGTWELRASNIVTDIEGTAPVVGNGMTLGLTDGVNNYGFEIGMTNAFLYAHQVSYSKATGSIPGSGNNPTNLTAGITTDATKSGLEANITKTSLTINVWERVA